MDQPQNWMAAFTLRLIDSRKKMDYWVAAAIAALPLAFAVAIGVASDADLGQTHYVGYLASWNFTSLVVLLPLGLFLFRWAMNRIGPLVEPFAPEQLPPVVALIQPNLRSSGYQDLRNALVDGKLTGLALGIDVIIHILDCYEFVPYYMGWTQTWAGEKHWALMFEIPERHLSVAVNATLLGLAKLAQFAIVLIPVLFFLIAIRHNLFFLAQIHQRRWKSYGQKAEDSIMVDLDDPEACFGFRGADRAFNVQVFSLGLCGMMMLVSRFVVAPLRIGQAGLEWLPALGQVMLPVGWLAALAAVSMPALVKFLPMLPIPGRGPAMAERSAVAYLQEFIPSKLWPVQGKPTPEELAYVAAKFATNSFWPTGNNRAKLLYFFSFYALIVLLIPLQPGNAIELVGAYLMAFPLVAGLLTWGGLTILGVVLSSIDERLVKIPATPVLKPESLASAARQSLPVRSEIELELIAIEKPRYRMTLKSRTAGSKSVQSKSCELTIEASGASALELARLDGVSYGKQLGGMVFGNEAIQQLWVASDAIAQSDGEALQVRLSLDETAADLHALRWETLHFAESPLFQGNDRWFSRFVTSGFDAGPEKRSRDQLKALVVIASPKQLANPDVKSEKKPIPVEAEKQRALGFLEGIASEPPVVLDSGGKASMVGIIDHLQTGFDIVYLICHGSLKVGVPRLMLETNDGSADFVPAKDLIESIRGLARPPALIVLASCQSAGTGDTEDALSALGPQLSAAGVPAVVAMLGKVDILTVAEFMPRFFAELKRDGQVDRAMAVARGEIARKFNDYWMPALFMRNESGELWSD